MFMMIILMTVSRMTGRNRGNDIMVRFTDSPYEYIMVQKPDAGRVRETVPPGHKCHGCPYGRGRPCVGICMKDLCSADEKTAGEADAVLEEGFPVPDNGEMP